MDFIDVDVFYSPAYWILVAMAILGLLIGFNSNIIFSGSESAPFFNDTSYLLIKVVLIILIFPIAYIIIKIVNR